MRQKCSGRQLGSRSMMVGSSTCWMEMEMFTKQKGYPNQVRVLQWFRKMCPARGGTRVLGTLDPLLQQIQSIKGNPGGRWNIHAWLILLFFMSLQVFWTYLVPLSFLFSFLTQGTLDRDGPPLHPGMHNSLGLLSGTLWVVLFVVGFF